MVRVRFFGFAGPAPLGLLGTLVMLVATERLVERNHLVFTSSTPLTWRYSQFQARRVGPATKILCLGSSKIKFGVQARVIERATGLPTYNLAVYSGTLASSYYLFKHALDAGSRPSAVVIDTLDGPIPWARSRVVAEGVERSLRCLSEVLTPSEVVELAGVARSPRFLAEGLLAYVLPSFRSRLEVRSWVIACLSGRGGVPAWIPANQLMHWNGGWNPAYQIMHWNANKGGAVAAGPRVATTGVRAGTAPTPPGKIPDGLDVHNPMLDYYSRKVLDLASSRGITVYWVFPPICPWGQDKQCSSGEYRFHLEYARLLQGRYPNMVVVDARLSGYGDDAFFEPVHLNAAGGAAFSAALGEVIARCSANPAHAGRWAVLPSYRPGGLIPEAEPPPQMSASPAVGDTRF